MRQDKERLRRKANTRNSIYKILRNSYVVSFYFASIYILESHFDLSLFVKLGILYGIVKFLQRT